MNTISVRTISAFIRRHDTFKSTKKEVLKELGNLISKKTKPVKVKKEPMPKYIDMRGHVDRY